VGLIAGFVIAALVGLVPASSLQLLAETSWVALPDPSFIGYRLDTALIPAFLTAGVAATLRTIGVVTTCQKLNDAEWKHPDMRTIRGGTLADGLGCLVAGLSGGIGLNAAPSLVGVSNAARATSRAIAYVSGAILIAMAFIPKFAALFL